MLYVVSRSLACHQVKAEHMRLGEMLQLLPLPKPNWDYVTCDSVMGLPPTRCPIDTERLIVDQLAKSTHFIPIRKACPLITFVGLYKDQIIKLQGVPGEIVSNRDPRFTFALWTSLRRELGIETRFSTTYHPQIDGQLERTIQILEDLLRPCVLDFGCS